MNTVILEGEILPPEPPRGELFVVELAVWFLDMADHESEDETARACRHEAACLLALEA